MSFNFHKKIVNKRLLYFILLILSGSIFAVEKDIQVIVYNATTGKPGKADNIKIIELEGGMKVLSEKKNISDKTIFKNISISNNVPILIQVSYMNINYNKIIPPTGDFLDKPIEITVYNSSANQRSIDTKSLMQIIRARDEILINKIYLFTNNSNPPTSYYNPENFFEVFIPNNAKEIYGQLHQNDSKMGIPLGLPIGKKGRVMDRAILPGSSELQISYSLPAPNIESIEVDDKLLFEQKKNGLVIFLKPKDLELKITGAKETLLIEKDIPSGMKAIRVTYPALNESIKLFITNGTPIKQDDQKPERLVSNGKIFIDWQKSALGIVITFSLLLLFQTIFRFLEKNQNEILQKK